MKKTSPEKSRRIDYKKDFKELYLPPAEPVIIKVPTMSSLWQKVTGSMVNITNCI